MNIYVLGVEYGLIGVYIFPIRVKTTYMSLGYRSSRKIATTIHTLIFPANSPTIPLLSSRYDHLSDRSTTEQG